MKGVILAGGIATKLYPLTHATNKHLLPVFDKPMVHYPIETLLRSGIDDILIVTGGTHAGDFIPVLRNGKEFGIKHLEYTYQEKPEGGIADALSLAEDFAEGGPVTVILGDNTTDCDIKKYVENFEEGANIFLKQVSDPQKYGVPVFSKPKKGVKPKILEIEEKPKKPASQYAVTGMYIYDNSVFDVIRNLKPSERGHLEITDVNNYYLSEGKLKWYEIEDFWTDAGTPASLIKANVYWAAKRGVSLI